MNAGIATVDITAHFAVGFVKNIVEMELTKNNAIIRGIPLNDALPIIFVRVIVSTVPILVFLNNAIIIEGDDVDLAKLIKDKKAIVGNKKYPWDDNHKWISYKLDGKQQEMFIFIKEDKIIIQVGLSDEGPKYIAYEK